jgi:hypothetical protein
MPQQHLDNMARYEEYRRKRAVQVEGEVQSPIRRQVEEQKAVVNEWGVMPDAATLQRTAFICGTDQRSPPSQGEDKAIPTYSLEFTV